MPQAAPEPALTATRSYGGYAVPAEVRGVWRRAGPRRGGNLPRRGGHRDRRRHRRGPGSRGL